MLTMLESKYCLLFNIIPPVTEEACVHVMLKRGKTMEVAMDPPCMTWNKALSLSIKWRRHGSRADVFTSAVLMVFGSALILATFVLVVVVAHFNSWDYIFLTF